MIRWKKEVLDLGAVEFSGFEDNFIVMGKKIDLIADLKKHFGFDTFKGNQQEVIENISVHDKTINN